MDKIIDLNAYPVSNLLKLLLKDKTTKQNIIFATSVYSTDENPIKETDQMTETILRGFNSCEIQPRVSRSPGYGQAALESSTPPSLAPDSLDQTIR